MEAEKLVRELPKGLIRWYEFQKGSRVLLLTGKSDPCEILKEALLECGLIVDMAAFWIWRQERQAVIWEIMIQSFGSEDWREAGIR